MHTPEPWFYNPNDGFPVLSTKLKDGLDDGLGYVVAAFDPDLKPRKDDGRRLALSVNACKGITNQALESGIVQELIGALQETLKAIDGVKPVHIKARQRAHNALERVR